MCVTGVPVCGRGGWEGLAGEEGEGSGGGSAGCPWRQGRPGGSWGDGGAAFGREASGAGATGTSSVQQRWTVFFLFHTGGGVVPDILP